MLTSPIMLLMFVLMSEKGGFSKLKNAAVLRPMSVSKNLCKTNTPN